MHIRQFVLSWTANLSFSRDEQIRFSGSIGWKRHLRMVVVQPGNAAIVAIEATCEALVRPMAQRCREAAVMIFEQIGPECTR